MGCHDLKLELRWDISLGKQYIDYIDEILLSGSNLDMLN